MEVVKIVLHGMTDRQTDKVTYRSSQPELNKLKQNIPFMVKHNLDNHFQGVKL